MVEIPKTDGSGGDTPPAQDSNVKIIKDVRYVPESDLLTVKGSLGRQLTGATETLQETQTTLTARDKELVELRAKQELAGAEGTKLDGAQKRVLDQATSLHEQKGDLDTKVKTLENDRAAFETEKVEAKVKELSVVHGVDEVVLREFKDPKDMEIAALREVTKRGTKPRIPAAAGVVPGSAEGLPGSGDLEATVLHTIENAMKRAGVPSDQMDQI